MSPVLAAASGLPQSRRRCAALCGLALAASASALSAQGVPVVGEVRWVDSIGGRHPVRNAFVEAVDADRDVAVDSSFTGPGGTYRLAVRSPAVRRVYVRVHSRSPSARVVSPDSGRTHSIRSRAQPRPAAGQPFRVDTIRGERDSAANRAFSVLDALEYGAAFVRVRRDTLDLEQVDAHFPAAAGSVSRFDGKRLHIQSGHAWAWDVVLHEYGHYVARSLKLTSDEEGDHLLNDVIAGPKRRAVRLAWAEGWASYFAVAAQREMKLADLGIPTVGDALYSDPTSPPPGMVDLSGPDPSWSFGEKSEVSVMRVLYDLDDGEDDPGGSPGDSIALGTQGLWKRLRSGTPATLHDAWGLATAGLDRAELGRAAAILAAQQVAPTLLEPDDGDEIRPSAPKFVWSNPIDYDRFVLEVVTSTGDTALLQQVIKRSFEPEKKDWGRVLERAKGSPLFWRVRGRDGVTDPLTGPYPSPWRRLEPAKQK